MKRTHPIFNFNKPSSNEPGPSRVRPRPKLLNPIEESGSTSVEKIETNNQFVPIPSNSNASQVVNVVGNAGEQREHKKKKVHPSTVGSKSAPPKPYGRWANPRQPNENKKRRQAKKQRKIVPESNVGVQNRTPMHGGTDQLEKGNCEKILDWARSSWRKSIASARRVKTCAGKVLKKVMDKKREWDEWDPNKDHPVARCIDESKLAGLKETIKPRRGILYRSERIFII
jgi:hypothetical protein